MKRIIALVLLVLCLSAFCACGSNTESNPEEATADEATTSVSYDKITTPYADLKLRQSIAENVDHKVTGEDPYTVSFSVKDDQKEIFAFVFGGKGQALVGTIVGKDKNTVVYMNVSEISKDSPNYERYTQYQQGVNDIIQGLIENSDFVRGEEIEEDKGTFDIKTSLVTLKFPNKWKDKVKVDVEDDSVKFSVDETPVFDLYFRETDGYKLGTYKETPIYVKDYNVTTPEQTAVLKDINVILENLKKDSNFKQ